MTNRDFLLKVRDCVCFKKYIRYLGEHGHGHYHSSSMVIK